MISDTRAKFGVREKSGSGIMGKKGGQKGSPGESFGFFSKSLSRLLPILCMRIEVDSGFVLPQTACRYRFLFWSYGPKSGSPKRSRTEPFGIFSKNYH